jgi:hypothetical protein
MCAVCWSATQIVPAAAIAGRAWWARAEGFVRGPSDRSSDPDDELVAGTAEPERETVAVTVADKVPVLVDAAESDDAPVLEPVG